jgi:hypothetical protein
MSILRKAAQTVRRATGVSPASFLWTASRGILRIYNPGMNVYERDWDVLVILDACRPDMMRRIGPEYGFEEIETVWSIANMSEEWMERTFIDDYADQVESTAYVTGNPFTRFQTWNVHELHEVWKWGWDDELKGVPARPITDTAIRTWEETGAERMIIHYMQPHFPSVPHPDVGDFGDLDSFGNGWDTVWTEAGDAVPWDVVEKAYDDNLRYVLEEVNLLLDNLDADRVSITADHANAMGEFGFRGHPHSILHPAIRRVPWIDMSGRGPGDHVPETNIEGQEAEVDVEERLVALGYR